MTYGTINTAGLSSEAKLCVERVLRTTASNIDITKGEAFIKEQVAAELEKVVESGGLVGALKDKEAAAAVLTVAFIGFAKFVDVVNQGIETLKVKRDNLREQMKLNLPVFIVPDKEDLSDEQEFIKDLIELVRATEIDGFEEGLGIRSDPPKKRGDPTCYHVLPFYEVETDGIEDDSYTEELNSKRRDIHEHIRTTLEDLREYILNDFKSGNWATHVIWSMYEGDNHLNNYNQRLFTLTMLANLLWKLLHPMNSQTGKRLTSAETIDLCEKVDVFLSHILTVNYRPYLKKNRKTDWADFIHVSQILVQDLQSAYAVEQLKEFPIRPLSTHARETAKITAKVLFELLYQHHDEFSNKYKAEPKTAEHLEATLKNLLNLLKENPDFLAPFARRVGLLPDDISLHKVLNPIPKTLIDILIIYTHLPRFERLRLREELAVLDEEDGGFLRHLEKFDERYVRTLNKVLKTDPKAGFEGTTGRENRAHLIGRRLIPCLTLLIDTFKIPVDTKESYESVKQSQDKLSDASESNFSNELVQKTGKEQVALINDLNRSYLRKEKLINTGENVSDLNNPVPYFLPHASALVNEKKKFVTTIDRLIPNIQKMADVASFVEGLKVVILDYGSVLQNQHFLDLLKICIDDVSEAQSEFKGLIEKTRKKYAKNGSMNNELKCRLAAITSRLQDSLKDFTIAAITVRQVISDPEFAETQQASFRKKIQFVDAKYADAFDKPCGFSKIFLKKKGEDAKSSYARMNPLLGLSPDSPLKRLSSDLLASQNAVSGRAFVSELPSFLEEPSEGSEHSKQDLSIEKRKKFFRYKHYYREGMRKAKHLMAKLNRLTSSDAAGIDVDAASREALHLDIVSTTGTTDSEERALQQVIYKEPRNKELERFSLMGLIDVCHDSMSYWSQWGHKGTLLKNLKKRVEQDEDLTPLALRRYILDLVRVASSYRRTWLGFFQAGYVHSNSAERLVRGMLDKKVNLVLPIAEVVFGNKDIDLSTLTRVDIQKELVRLRATADWEFAEDEILERNLSGCMA